ncbi:LysR family transcriptional regulator [Caballeronia sp. J97]|uniref:LysR family transcriptional regulator n=1 Tax=Caballeronia sp. J97 TaxID=2805429 RepID=UPI002AB300F9|nr:LysR family transcriptional regulator [Caballeronia sp. J97]
MTLRQLRYFVEIARTRSITHAAITLGVAQPALSTHIAALENELGVRLLERHAKGVELSEAGERLYARAVELISGFDNLKRDVNQTEDSPVGKVRLCIGGAIAAIVAPPLLRSMAERYPLVDLHVTDALSHEIQIQLEAGAAELALMPNAAEIPGMSSTSVLEEPFMLFGATELMRDKASCVLLADIAGFPLAAPDRAYDARKVIERVAANAGLSLDIRYELNSTGMLIGVVKEGLAYAVLPSNLCHEAVATGTLSRRAIDSPLLTRVQAIVWLSDRILTPAAMAVRDQLVQTVRLLVASGRLEGRAV